MRGSVRTRPKLSARSIQSGFEPCKSGPTIDWASDTTRIGRPPHGQIPSKWLRSASPQERTPQSGSRTSDILLAESAVMPRPGACPRPTPQARHAFRILRTKTKTVLRSPNPEEQRSACLRVEHRSATLRVCSASTTAPRHCTYALRRPQFRGAAHAHASRRKHSAAGKRRCQ